MKKSHIILIVIGIIAIHLSLRYYINENFKDEYYSGNTGSMEIRLLKLINFPQSYIVYFNSGDSYYQREDYEKAVSEFNRALSRAPKSKQCIIRNNIALTELAMIDYENSNNLEEELIAVEEILLEDDCATEDNNGKDANSQELYNEIEKLLNGGGGGSDGDDQNDGEDTDDLEDKLKEQQEQSSSERNDELDQRTGDYSYDGEIFANGRTGHANDTGENEEEGPVFEVPQFYQ